MMNNAKLFFQLLLCSALAFMTAGCTATTGTKGQNKERTATVNEDSVYLSVDQQPSFPGGESEMLLFHKKNIHIEQPFNPTTSRLTISFIVEKDGTLSNFEILSAPTPQFGDESVKVFQSMPKWEPGKKDGKNVRTKYVFTSSYHFQ
ncbi:MAG: energy transducer TonB [Bacteroidales bacterium]|nr:energy transducer TonB [Bacteroidales bacterium]